MKTLWTTGLVIGLVLLAVGMTVSADNKLQALPMNGYQFAEKHVLETATSKTLVSEDLVPGDDRTQGVETTSRVHFKGIWGLAEDNETKGYVGGILSKRNRFVVLKGVWNTTDSDAQGKVAGILKRGFFIGKVTNANGDSARITGFYRFNEEKQQFHLRWMTPYKLGWAYCRITIA
jgi:hypothetical protein